MEAKRPMWKDGVQEEEGDMKAGRGRVSIHTYICTIRVDVWVDGWWA